MEDKDFIELMYKRLNELHNERIDLDEEARIQLMILKHFKTTLIEFVTQSTKDKIFFTRELITQEVCNLDLRHAIDDEIILLVARKGYKYLEAESTYSVLVFKKHGCNN